MLNSKNERELAYVVLIDNIEPIIGSDNCECAIVGGWHIMVRKGQFNIGDPAIYFEIDSKVPSTNSAFAFLEKRNYKVKTQKFTFGGKGNFISQGLLMHPSDFGWEIQVDGSIWIPGDGDHGRHYTDDESRFLTKILGVTYADDEDNQRKAKTIDPNAKYLSMKARHKKFFSNKFVKRMWKYPWFRKLCFFFMGKKKDKPRGFPTKFLFVHKSDEERIENCSWYLNDQEHTWIKTVKIDGTSSLYVLERLPRDKREYYVCSRNVRQADEKQETYHGENVYWSVEFKYHIRDFLEAMLKEHPDWSYVAIQGETAGVGETGTKIQGDPHEFGELRFFAYNFIDSVKGRWNSIEARNLLAKYGIEFVPIVDENYILPKDLNTFKLEADGDCEAPGAHGLREGYVYRRTDDCNISFKNVSNKYLLKEGK